MAGIILDLNDDIKKLQQLRSEIEEVKKALGSINVKVDIDIANGLEERLRGLTGQYSDLVSKVAEAEGRAKASADRIGKAAEKIAMAQEKMAKSSDKERYGDSTSGKSSIDATTKSVDEQAKAYEELKGEIDSVLGTRDQNVRLMIEEQNAIRVINMLIKETRKTYTDSNGVVSQKGLQLLEKYNNDLLTHKEALAQARRELANQAKLNNAAETSMNALSQSLSRMRIAYRELTAEERESDFGKELLASIQQADAKIKELDATIGNHQRNVGNYASGFNGLKMSVQQVVRELPAATMGVNTFFLAISNNIPILTDEIKRAMQMNKQMKAQNQGTIPVWKQLVSSIFSWQTALVVAITVMSMYGKEIVAWIGNLFKADDALEETRERQEAFAKFQKKMNEEWRDSVARTAGTQIAQYRKLSREWASLGDNIKAKERFVRDNQQAFHDLGISVDGVSQAERLFVGNTDAVVSAITARARAAAYEENITKAQQRYIKQTETNWGTKKGGGYYATAKAGDEYGPDDKNISETYGLERFTDYTEVGHGHFTNRILTASGAAKVNARRNREALKKLRENNRLAKEELDKEIERNVKGIEEQSKYAQDLFSKAGVKEYKPSDGASSTGYGEKSASKEASDRLKVQEELNKDLLSLQQKNQDDEIALMQEGTEKKLAEIDNDYKKRIAEIDKQEAEFKKGNKEAGANGLTGGLTGEQQDELKKARDNAAKEQEKRTKEALEEELQGMRDYLKQYGTFQQQKEAIARQAADEIRKIEESSYGDGEKEWRIRSIRESARKEEDSVEAEAIMSKVDWYQVFGNLGGIMTDAMRPMLEELKEYTKTDAFRQMGAEEQQRIVEAMGNMRSMMGDNTDVGWKDLAADLTEYQEALREATDAQEELDSKQEAYAGILDVLKKKMDKARNDGDRGAYESAKGEYDRIMLDMADSGKRVTDANEKVRASGTKLAQTTESVMQPMDEIHKFLSTTGLTDLQTLWDSFNQLKGGISTLKAIDEAGKNIGDAGEKMAEGAENAGDEVAKSLADGISKAGVIGQIVAAILKILDILRDGIGTVISSLIDSILSAIDGILDNLLSGKFISQIVGSIVKGIGGIIDNVIGKLGSVLSFGALSSGGPSEWFGGSNAKEVQETIDRLSERNELLRKSIDDLTDTIKGGEGRKSVEAYEEAVRMQEEANQNYLDIAKAQAGYVGSHHSWNAYWGGFTQDEISELSKRIGRQWNGDLFDLSPEEMKQLRGMVDTWERIQNTGKGGYGGRLTEKLDDYIDQAGELDDLMEQLNESLTQVSFDSVYDSFIDTLMDMDASAEDFANDFSEYMMRALLSNQVGEAMKDNLESWYEKWSGYMKDNELSDEELNDLRGEWQDMVNEGLSLRDRLAESIGYTGDSSSSSQQSASSKGFETMSQDTGEELNGRFTAMYETELSIADITSEQLSVLKAIYAQMGGNIADVASESKQILSTSYIQQNNISFPTAQIDTLVAKVDALDAKVADLVSFGADNRLSMQGVDTYIEDATKNSAKSLSLLNDIKRNTQNL